MSDTVEMVMETGHVHEWGLVDKYDHVPEDQAAFYDNLTYHFSQWMLERLLNIAIAAHYGEIRREQAAAEIERQNAEDAAEADRMLNEGGRDA